MHFQYLGFIHLLFYSYTKGCFPCCVSEERDFLGPSTSISGSSQLKSLGGRFAQAFSDAKGWAVVHLTAAALAAGL